MAIEDNLYDWIMEARRRGTAKGMPPKPLTQPKRKIAQVTTIKHKRRLNEPTLADMATNFAKATAGWVTAGFPVVPEAEYDRRLAICRSCQFWDESARLGYGKCNHKSCGCGKGKLWMGSQSCPEKLW